MASFSNSERLLESHRYYFAIMELSNENNNIFRKLEKVIIYLSNEPLPPFFVMAPSMESPIYWNVTCDFILLKLVFKAQTLIFDDHNSKTIIQSLSKETGLPLVAIPKIDWLIARCELIVNELYILFVKCLPDLYFYQKIPATNEVFQTMNFSEAKMVSCSINDATSAHLTRHQKQYILKVIEYRGISIANDEIDWDVFLNNYLQMPAYYQPLIIDFLKVIFFKCNAFYQNERQEVKELLQTYIYSKIESADSQYYLSKDEWISQVYLSVIASRISLFLRLRNLFQKYILPPPIDLHPWNDSPLFWNSTQDLFMIEVIAQVGLSFSTIVASSFGNKIAEGLEKNRVKNKATSAPLAPSDFLQALFELEIASYPVPISASIIESHFAFSLTQQNEFNAICPMQFLFQVSSKLKRLEDIIRYYEKISSSLQLAPHQENTTKPLIGNPMKADFYFNRFDGPLLYNKKEIDKLKEMQPEIRNSKKNPMPDSTRPIINDPFYNLFTATEDDFQDQITEIISPDFMQTVENYPIGIDDDEFLLNPMEIERINQLKPPEWKWPKAPRTLFLTPNELEQSIKTKTNKDRISSPDGSALATPVSPENEMHSPTGAENEPIKELHMTHSQKLDKQQQPKPLYISPPTIPSPSSQIALPELLMVNNQNQHNILMTAQQIVADNSPLSPTNRIQSAVPMTTILMNNQIPGPILPNLIAPLISNSQGLSNKQNQRQATSSVSNQGKNSADQQETTKPKKKSKKDKEKEEAAQAESDNGDNKKKKRGKKEKQKEQKEVQKEPAKNGRKKRNKNATETSPLQQQPLPILSTPQPQPEKVPEKFESSPSSTTSSQAPLFSLINTSENRSNTQQSLSYKPIPIKPLISTPRHEISSNTVLNTPNPVFNASTPVTPTSNQNMNTSNQVINTSNGQVSIILSNPPQHSNDNCIGHVQEGSHCNTNQIQIIIKGKTVASVQEMWPYKKAIVFNGQQFDFLLYATSHPFLLSQSGHSNNPVFVIECIQNNNVFASFVSNNFLNLFKLFKNGLEKLNEDGKNIYPHITVNSAFKFFNVPISIDIWDLVELID